MESVEDVDDLEEETQEQVEKILWEITKGRKLTDFYQHILSLLSRVENFCQLYVLWQSFLQNIYGTFVCLQTCQ